MIPFDDLKFQTDFDSSENILSNVATKIEKEAPEAQTHTAQQSHEEDTKDHFADIPVDFLQDLTDIFDEFDITDIDAALNFDMDMLSSKLIAKGRMGDLVKDLLTQWKKALQEAVEQQRLIEEEIERKKRAKRPIWRCKACGRPGWNGQPGSPGCPVAPYIEGYIEVDT